MERREALRYMGLGFAGVTMSTVISTFWSCQGEHEAAVPSDLRFLSGDQFLMVRILTDIILPATKSPGAGQAGVARFIDVMLHDCYYEQDQQEFRKGLRRVGEGSENFGSSFEALPREEQTELLQMEAKSGAEGVPSRFFQILKELTLFGYFTSEIGATQALRYDPVPGTYEGCIPLEPDDTSWTLQS